MHDRAANHLVGVLGIDAEAHVHLDGLVELGELDLLDEGNCFFELDTGALLPASTRLDISYLVFVPYLLIGASGPSANRARTSH